MQPRLILALALLTLSSSAAEHKFDFSEIREGLLPPGFRSALTGEGKPGSWKVLLDEVPSLFPPLTPQAAAVARKPVLAQTAQDPTDEHFPLLIYDTESFGDFTLTVRIKTMGGTVERMAGVAFRLQNETNYYVVRASSLGNTFRFYKVVNGQRSPPIGPEAIIPSGVWHDLTVICKGNKIQCLLNGKELIPVLTDNSFARGKIGFWTKSDSVSYFCDPKIVYTPREAPAQALLRDIAKKYPRLLALRIYVPAGAKMTRVVASKDETELGQNGGKTEEAVIRENQIYYGKEKDSVSVVLPVRDRNGEAMAAVRVVMRPFSGQTEQNAIIRAQPIAKELESRAQSIQDLLEP